MTDNQTVDAILANIQTIVANMLGRVSMTLEEVDEIYASGEYPEINATIDYIIDGKKS